MRATYRFWTVSYVIAYRRENPLEVAATVHCARHLEAFLQNRIADFPEAEEQGAFSRLRRWGALAAVKQLVLDAVSNRRTWRDVCAGARGFFRLVGGARPAITRATVHAFLSVSMTTAVMSDGVTHMPTVV